MKNTISAPSLCNLTTLRSKRTLNVNVWAVWTTDTIKLFLLLLHAVTTAQQPENLSFEFCSASDWIYCNVDIYKRVSTSVFATTELLYLDMWMGIHKSEKTHCCGDGQIPSEKKKIASWWLSRGRRRTHTESRLTGSSEMKAVFYFFFLRGYRKKLQSGAVARKRAAFGEVNRRRSATAAISFKLPRGFVSVRPQLGSPSSHRGSAFSVPGTSGLVIGGRWRVHGKTYFGKAQGNHSLPSPLAFSAVIVDPAILTLTLIS